MVSSCVPQASARSLELRPGDVKFLATHALVNSRLQEHEVAVPLWEAVCAARPRDAAAHHFLAASHLALARASCLLGTFGHASASLQAGVEHAKEAAALQPRTASVWKLLGDLYTQAFHVYPPAFGLTGAVAGGGPSDATNGATLDGADGPRGVIARDLIGYAQLGAAAYASAVTVAMAVGADPILDRSTPSPDSAAYSVELQAGAWCDLATNLYLQVAGARARAGSGSGLVTLSVARLIAAPTLAAAARLFRYAAHLAPQQVRECPRCMCLFGRIGRKPGLPTVLRGTVQALAWNRCV